MMRVTNSVHDMSLGATANWACLCLIVRLLQFDSNVLRPQKSTLDGSNLGLGGIKIWATSC